MLETTKAIKLGQWLRPCQQRTRFFFIALHLRDKRIESVEFYFAAQVAKEGNFSNFSIEVA